MSDSIKTQWAGASAKFAARPKREKMILAGAALALAWALVDGVWLGPATRELKTQKSALEKKEKELAQIEAQKAAAQQAVAAREAAQKKGLEAARVALSEVTEQLAEFEKTLVPARRMPEFLRGLLPAGAVDVVSLRTLEPTPLIVRAGRVDKDGVDGKGGKESKEAEASPKPTGPAANIYRHGIEITLAGDFDALLAYLTRLEAAPQQVLWGRLDFKSIRHPRNEMTLVLYTLSLDPSWLVV